MKSEIKVYEDGEEVIKVVREKKGINLIRYIKGKYSNTKINFFF